MHKENQCEEVIMRNSDLVYRFAYSLVKTRIDADDIYQEVFMRYVKAGPVFASKEHEKAWFIRVTVNCCKNYWKSPWIRRRAVFDEASIMQIEKQPHKQPLRSSTVVMIEGAEAAQDEEGERLIRIVKQLPEKYRVVLHLFYYEEMSIEEITKATGIKASTVRTRLTRARRKLKEKLGGF